MESRLFINEFIEDAIAFLSEVIVKHNESGDTSLSTPQFSSLFNLNRNEKLTLDNKVFSNNV